MSKKRVHILTTVNAAQVSKSGGIYTIKDVCGAIDNIVMNGRLYPADQLAASASSLNDKPAPAGHPKDDQGRYISATNGKAMLSSYIGSICTNARHEGGRLLCDVLVNEAQANAHADGKALVQRLDAAIGGTNAEPIHVSTGLFCEEVKANGESLGKKYDAIAVNMRFDHLAILLHEQGAGTPDEGVGMFLANSGEEQPVDVARLDVAPADRRFEGVIGWLRKLLGNASELSFDQIQSLLRKALPDGGWPIEVYARHLVWVDQENRLWRQDYALASDGSSVSLQSEPAEVVRRVEYQPVVTNQQEKDEVKEHILAALNAAGISTDGKTDAELLFAYNAHVGSSAVKPVQEQLTAANAKVQSFEAEAQKAKDAERDTLAAKLAVNSSLTVEDLKLLPLDRLKALDAAGKGAAPVIVGNAGQGGNASAFASYDLNAILEGK